MTDRKFREIKTAIKTQIESLLNGTKCESTKDLETCKEQLTKIKNDVLWLQVAIRNELITRK